MTAKAFLAAALWLAGRWRAWSQMRKKRHDLPGAVAVGSLFSGAAIGLAAPERAPYGLVLAAARGAAAWLFEGGVAGRAASLLEAAEAAMQAEGDNHASSQE